MPDTFPSAPPTDRSDRSSDNNSTRLSRRLFGKHAAFLAAAAISPADLLATPHHDRHAATNANSLPPTPAADKLTAAQLADIEAKLANIVRKYGDRLTATQRTHLRHILAYNEKMLAAVRAVPLENGDPPASVLRVTFERESQTPDNSSRGAH